MYFTYLPHRVKSDIKTQIFVLFIININLFALTYCPRYSHKDIRVETFIPSQVKKGQSMQITLTSSKLVVASVFVISFKVQSEDLEREKRLVLAVWWLPFGRGGEKKR